MYTEKLNEKLEEKERENGYGYTSVTERARWKEVKKKIENVWKQNDSSKRNELPSLVGMGQEWGGDKFRKQWELCST